MLPLRQADEAEHKEATHLIDNQSLSRRAMLFEGVVQRAHIFVMTLHAASLMWSSATVCFSPDGMVISGKHCNDLAVTFRIERTAWLTYETTYLLRTCAPTSMRICVHTLFLVLNRSALTACECISFWVPQNGTKLHLAVDGMQALLPLSIVSDNCCYQHTSDSEDDPPLRIDGSDFRRMLHQVVDVDQGACTVHLLRFEDDIFVQLRAQFVGGHYKKKGVQCDHTVCSHVVVNNWDIEMDDQRMSLKCRINVKHLCAVMDVIYGDCAVELVLRQRQPLCFTVKWGDYVCVSFQGDTPYQ